MALANIKYNIYINSITNGAKHVRHSSLCVDHKDNILT